MTMPITQNLSDLDVSRRDDEFSFVRIDGFLSLTEATEQLVHVAKCMQETHSLSSAVESKATMRHVFQMRKASVNALLDLVELYIEQIPDKT